MKKILVAAGMVVVSSVSFGQDISKDMWFGQMKTALPQYFCSTEQYFRQCFNVQESQCKMVATDATDACLKQYERKIPSKLKLPVDGAHWGQQIGMCAGNAYEVALHKQRINTAKCNNPDNWK